MAWHRGAFVAVLVVAGLMAGTRTGEARPSGLALRNELLALLLADQAERTGVSTASDDRSRARRLEEILDEHGWPTPELVGDDGVTAVWAIAQHADFDVGFQRRVRDMMREAVDRGDADPGELAYLEDRVALNSGEEQIYGTQVGCVEGGAEPAPLRDPDGVEARRAEAGLQPLEDYLAEMTEVCASEP